MALVACSEANVDGGGGGTTTSASGTSTVASTGAPSSSTGMATSTGSTSSGGPGGVVINEMSGAGDDYIELFNAGSDTADLSGLRVADQESPGVPKLADAVELPPGTTLPKGAYLFILGGVKDPVGGPVTDCAPGPAPCFQAGFKLSNASGDAGVPRRAGDKILEQDTYPGGLADGSTWSRLPNGVGLFGEGDATPGA
ncbi:MAG: lamin tail domain-containing protein [Polyangiaceae bacterium]